MRLLRSAFQALLFSLLLVLSAQGLGAPLNQLTDAEQRGGWKLLFDGKRPLNGATIGVKVLLLDG